MSERSLRVVPEPKEVTWGKGGFVLNGDTWIVLLPDAGKREHASAQSLQQEVLAATGLRLPIVKTARPVRDENIVLLVSDWAAARALAGERVSAPKALSAHGDQAYLVDISPGRVIAGGEGANALHYAVQTLRQIARLEGARWPGARVLDWPTLPYRGLMLDVSRGRVPSLWLSSRATCCSSIPSTPFSSHTTRASGPSAARSAAMTCWPWTPMPGLAALS